jgi:hypothetical protein
LSPLAGSSDPQHSNEEKDEQNGGAISAFHRRLPEGENKTMGSPGLETEIYWNQKLGSRQIVSKIDEEKNR